MSEGAPLNIRLEGGELVISIGVATLADAIRRGPYFENLIVNPRTGGFDEDRLIFTDCAAFARGVLEAMTDEREDGTTAVHILFDKAAQIAFENGAEGVELMPPALPRRALEDRA